MNDNTQNEIKIEFPVPEGSETLFKEFNDDYTFNAIISSGIDKFFLFSDGYKNASLKLFAQLEGDTCSADTIVYPLVFINRHFLELRLKELISGLNYVITHKYSFPNGHNLEFLWNTYKALLSEVEDTKNTDIDGLAQVEKLILEFNNVDSSSFSFRYPVETSSDRNPSLTIRHLDLQNFQNTMIKLYNYFDSHSDMIFYLTDLTDEFIITMRSEYEHEMRSYYGM